MNLETAEEIVPPSLFSLLAWFISASDDFEFDKYVTVTDDKKTKFLSKAEDIIFLAHNGSAFTPKHYTIGLITRHLCGSSKLVNNLNGLGHFVPHLQVLEHDTAITENKSRKEMNRQLVSSKEFFLHFYGTIMIFQKRQSVAKALHVKQTILSFKEKALLMTQL